jgi:hypothetical protein
LLVSTGLAKEDRAGANRDIGGVAIGWQTYLSFLNQKAEKVEVTEVAEVKA